MLILSAFFILYFILLYCSLPLDLLKNFTHEMISLVFLYDSQPEDGITMEQYTEECIHACDQVLLEVQSAGFIAITISATAWVESVASVSVS